MITTDQLKDVLDRADALYKYLKIDEKKMEYEEEELRTQAPDFWEDQKRAEEQMKKVKGIKKWLDGSRPSAPLLMSYSSPSISIRRIWSPKTKSIEIT